MVKAWYMDDSVEDQRLPHHLNPPKYVDLSELHKRTGVEYFKVSFFKFFSYWQSAQFCLPPNLFEFYDFILG